MKTVITDKIESKKIHLKKDEQLTYITILKDGWEKKQSLDFYLEGNNSSVKFFAFIIGKGPGNFRFETSLTHKAKNTSGYFSTRSILFDKSSIDYKGSIKVAKIADKTKSFLNHHSLMFSEESRISTLPSLKIENDDAETGHSASIGKVDEDLIFYLQTRGINRKLGEKILIRGFIESDLQKIQNKKTLKKVTNEIDKLLTNQ